MVRPLAAFEFDDPCVLWCLLGGGRGSAVDQLKEKWTGLLVSSSGNLCRGGAVGRSVCIEKLDLKSRLCNVVVP